MCDGATNIVQCANAISCCACWVHVQTHIDIQQGKEHISPPKDTVRLRCFPPHTHTHTRSLRTEALRCEHRRCPLDTILQQRATQLLRTIAQMMNTSTSVQCSTSKHLLSVGTVLYMHIFSLARPEPRTAGSNHCCSLLTTRQFFELLMMNRTCAPNHFSHHSGRGLINFIIHVKFCCHSISVHKFVFPTCDILQSFLVLVHGGVERYFEYHNL